MNDMSDTARSGQRDEGHAAADGADRGSGHEPDDIHGVPDATLGGYLDTHDRPPAFEGPDGHPYTVSLEVEQTPNLRAPYAGYLVFPRWAATGLGVIGHVQTPLLCREPGRAAAEGYLRGLSLDRVKSLLDEGIEHRGEEAGGEPRPDPYSFGSE
jgi:hypothetical protein